VKKKHAIAKGIIKKYTIVALKLINLTSNSTCDTLFHLNFWRRKSQLLQKASYKECWLQQWKVTKLLSTNCVR